MLIQVNADEKIESSRLISAFANGDLVKDDGDDIYYKDVEIGTQDYEELSLAIEETVKRSSKFLSEPMRNELGDIVNKYKDIFRTKLGNDPPVDVPPMIIESENKEKPVKVRQRTYSPEQLKFLKKKCNELVRAGYIYRNSNSKWA